MHSICSTYATFNMLWLSREWAGFNMPQPFNGRVQNALIADARSVKLAALVGENGRWYAFGKMIVDL